MRKGWEQVGRKRRFRSRDERQRRRQEKQRDEEYRRYLEDFIAMARRMEQERERLRSAGQEAFE